RARGCTTMNSDVTSAARRAVFPWAVLALTLAGASCGHAQSTGGAQPVPSSPEVIEVADAEYTGEAGDPLEAACRDWRLSKGQVAEFFRLSQRYEQRSEERRVGKEGRARGSAAQCEKTHAGSV